MTPDFSHATLRTINKPVLRMGLACNYGIDADGAAAALERGVNYVFWSPFRTGKVTPVLKAALTDATAAELVKLRESGKVRAIGCSIHDRQRAGRLAEASPMDLLMVRYNAAHPGAERDIFPHLQTRKPNLVAYTATSWRKLLKKPSGWDGPVMSPGDCYRFCLSNPAVDVVLTGPASRAQLEENLGALEKGPLTPEEMEWMRRFGQAVHA